MGRFISAIGSDVPLDIAKQMAQIGVIPVLKTTAHAVGLHLDVAGQEFVLIAPATKEEYLQAVEVAGLDVEPFRAVPDDYCFYRISTD